MQADVSGAQDPGNEWWYASWTPTGEIMPYQLPPGLVCDGIATRCVLQWNYLTGMSAALVEV